MRQLQEVLAPKVRAVLKSLERLQSSEEQVAGTVQAMEMAAKRFFASQHFAVAGASQDQSKFGYKGYTPA